MSTTSSRLRGNAYSVVKRAMDLVFAVVLIVVLAPVAGVITLAILVAQGRPVYFRQLRTGLNGNSFRMMKFRTMRPDLDGSGTASDHLRVTRLGRFLRATSLDELPNIFNVLVGEMSIVGPRPMLSQFIEHHSEGHHDRRHDVRPGITGLAQVNGRNDLEYVERFEFDLQYVERFSFWLDSMIVLRTVPSVLLRRGASGWTPCDLAATDATIEPASERRRVLAA
ncbi:sugar transferase [Curtobacterium flaccumfaciens pv. oortii]|uniref:sugar transferase n=1 Tax=Curtobacterium flaccumfaciens TaxID=2035 RepID=UPI001BDDECD5|nr:sugar transferase [Curtobacterium flaccumfaciens]MBT1624277.1 sugar transferase [Curtobacterium flaccumfaciens pv. oortii]